MHPVRGSISHNGKGVYREVESEGSRRQNAGLTNRKRIEAVVSGEVANIAKAQYLHKRHGRKCDSHKREGTSALPGEIC